jgi:hypothetical protein
MAFGRLKSWFSSTWNKSQQVIDLERNPIGALPIPADVEAEINRALAMSDRRRFLQPDRLHPVTMTGPITPHSINEDLHRDLPRLMAQCAWRYATNPIFEGICNTYTQDVVGPDGPTLQIVSDDKKFNDEVEAAFRVVMSMPDPAGRLSGVENLKMWVRMLLTAGSFINVFRNVPRGRDMPNFGWSTVHPRRLMTPLEYVADDNVAFGIRIDPKTGAPKTYYLDKPTRFGSSEYSMGNFQQFDAQMVQHRYFAVEPEQLTGYPMMTSTLRTLDEIIQLDDATIQAAESAAKHSWWLKSSSPKSLIDPDPIAGSTFPVQNGVANVAPQGWEPYGLQATQPNADATNYRNVRLAEIGRPINMPLLIILLSVNEATFSSAQFAGALYRDGIIGVQRYLSRETMDALVEQVIIDLIISGVVRRPKTYQKVWTHNVPPHANIGDFVDAIEKQVEDGFISPAEATAMLGHDWEKVVEGRKRCKLDLETAGLPPAPVNAGNPPKPEPVEPKATPAAPANKATKPAPKIPKKVGTKRRREFARG